MKNKKNIFQNKIVAISLGILLFFGSGAGTFYYLSVNKKTTSNGNAINSTSSTTKSPITDTTTPTVTTPVTTSTTNDSLQSDLNNTNSQSSSLESEINSASTGLSDQQTNLTY